MTLRQLSRAMKRLLREGLEHFILPALAIGLPWSMYFRLLKYCCRSPHLLQVESAAAAAGYENIKKEKPSTEWLSRFRLMVMIDRADCFLSISRSNRWLDRHVQREGEWPASPFVGITFHFGAGLWSLRDIAHQDKRSSFLSLPLPLEAFKGHRIPHRASRLRLHEVARASGAPVIYTGGSLPQIRASLSSGVNLIGLIDVPPYQTRGLVSTRLFGQPAVLPSGLLKIAASEKVTTVSFIMSCDWDTGKRHLKIMPIPEGSLEQRVHVLAMQLEKAIAEQPEAWHLWPAASTFLAAARTERP